jgi:ketosteroid isomerase-like protein
VSENLDLVRSIYADWERGDFSRADWADAEIEWEFVGGPEPGTGVGVPALAAAVRGWIHAWTGWRVRADEYRELDRERVLVIGRRAGRGRTSGIDLDRVPDQGATLFEVRDSRVKRQVVYWDRDRALADLGLEE